jgi:hypothetical protein
MKESEPFLSHATTQRRDESLKSVHGIICQARSGTALNVLEEDMEADKSDL